MYTWKFISLDVFGYNSQKFLLQSVEEFLMLRQLQWFLGLGLTKYLQAAQLLENP
jgi:hypothetical protein